MRIIDNDLISMQEARILAENAREAQRILAAFPQEKLDQITKHMTEGVSAYIEELAKASADETDYGRWEDKYIKNRFVCEHLAQSIQAVRCVGIIREDKEKKVMDVGVPLGVIAALCPATSPVSTTIYKALIAVKSGNAIVFSPHPRAKHVMQKTLDILIQAAEKEGLPEGAIAYMHTVTSAGTEELLGHEATALILNTGVVGMLPAAHRSGKPLIYGGAGNGPAFIERTADIGQAAEDIINSRSFDYGVMPAAEQTIVADRPVANQVKQALTAKGAYFMTEEEADKLGNLLFLPCGSPNPEMTGLSAQKLACKAGFAVSDSVRVLISEQKYVSQTNPYARENRCPVMAYYVEDDWLHACEKCIELLLSERQGHTLVIHSRDEEVIRQFALKKPVGRMLVNTPAVFGSIGATTNLFPALTLGSGSAGHGITSDNVSPVNLIYVRKVGYGLRQIPAERNEGGHVVRSQSESGYMRGEGSGEAAMRGDMDTLHQILRQALGINAKD